MTIRLRPEHERTIAQAIESGAYRDADEVIGRALEALREEDEWLQARREEIERKIERGIAQFERGEVLTAEESQRDFERRKKAWLDERER
jgi:putative addiction module CopG family antidote